VPAVVGVLGVALVALLVYGLTQQGESRALDNAIANHEYLPAPDAAQRLPVLDRLSSPNASLRHWRGRVVVLNFWAQWCQTCLYESPMIEQAEHSLVASGAGTVVGIDYKDVSSQALGFIATHGVSYPNLRDISGSFATAYGTDALPETFVLDRRQRVVAVWRGPIPSEAALQRAIALAERT
jgi:cytochrome c biogenesis protein CcmG/thiol:disulfide interchange protein DsbE